MESLVDIAKRLGIRPNPHMTREERKQILSQITEEIKKKISPKYQDRVSFGVFWQLKDSYYALCKKVERKIDNPDQLKRNYSFFANLKKGITSPAQNGFLWHDATEKYPLRERFVADIQLDSPNFPEMVKKLDDFILKYKGQFKITAPKHTDRSDTLNMYLPYDITPKIAKEFVQIVRPCLSEKYDDFLNGAPLIENGKQIKGVRTGPEYSKDLSQNTSENEERVKKDLGTRIGLTDLEQGSSLGEKAATLATLDLAYYLAGKEGQNPFQLLSYSGRPYRKTLEINSDISSIILTPVKKVNPPKKSIHPAGMSFQNLLQQLSVLRSEISACKGEMKELRVEQQQTQLQLDKYNHR